MPELRGAARAALEITDAAAKTAAVAALAAAAAGPHGLAPDPRRVLPGVVTPGRPPRPALVHPREVPRRKLATVEGRTALLHALAHIEFNAINLALDAVARFAGLPEAYYLDWLRVATEEARHFELLASHLQTLGARYGDFPAHDGLWEMAAKTAGDPLARMGLVPRVLEARGLDVTPAIQGRLAQAGDADAVAILDIILREEVGHVAIGNRWFGWLCAERGLEPREAFERLLAEHGVAPPHPPFNEPARLAAGFEAEELALWAG